MPAMCFPGDRQRRVCKITSIIVGEDIIVGLTQLRNRIYVVCDESNVIAVFASEPPFTRLQDIVVRGLQNPWGIAASVDIGCLYVPDPHSDSVWRTSVDDGAVVEWLTGLFAVSVSVTSDDRVIVLVWTGMPSTGRCIAGYGEVHVYRADAVTETVTRLSPDITSPYSVVMTSKETFIVSHGGWFDDMHRVCEVDKTGRVLLKTFGSSRGNNVDQVNEPMSVSLDDEERVIVADFRNRRVLMLSRELTSPRVIASWQPLSQEDDFNRPHNLYYDSLTGNLLVGFENGRVDVFKLVSA